MSCYPVQERMLSQKTCASFCARCSELRPTDRHTHHRQKDRPTMTDRHTTHRESLEHTAYMLQLQIDWHMSTYARTKETMTDQIREERLVVIGELHQQLIDTKRKLRAMMTTFFPPPPQPTQPTKGEYDMTMIYTPTFGDDHE